jgi:hypothetical protein
MRSHRSRPRGLHHLRNAAAAGSGTLPLTCDIHTIETTRGRFSSVIEAAGALGSLPPRAPVLPLPAYNFHHDVISLQVLAQPERVRAGRFKPALPIKRNRAQILLPHVEPDGARFTSRDVFDCAHEFMRDAGPLNWRIDVETH